MAITANTVINRTRQTLLDGTGETWFDSELIDYLNAAIAFLMLHKPDVTITTATLPLTPNDSLQSIPSDGIQLIDVRRNIGGKVITQMKRNVADSNNPSWTFTPTTATAIDHFVFDERNPTRFYVMPVPTTSFNIEIEYARQPVRIVVLTDAIPVLDVYEVPLHFLTVAHAYMKNTKRGDMSKANSYLTYAANLLGIKLQQQMLNSPKNVEDDNSSTGE